MERGTASEERRPGRPSYDETWTLVSAGVGANTVSLAARDGFPMAS